MLMPKNGEFDWGHIRKTIGRTECPSYFYYDLITPLPPYGVGRSSL